MNFSVNPLQSIDTGPSGQFKNSSLTIVFGVGTTTLNQSSVLFANNGTAGMVNVQNFGNVGMFPAAQSGPFIAPMGFMWTGTNPLLSAYDLSVGTSSAFSSIPVK